MAQRISKTESIIIIAISLLAIAVLTISAGGPRFSDELAYIAPGINGFENLGIMNRYFHVYIQAFFMQLAPSPITGVRLFWSSEMVLTALMIYFGIRLLSRKTTAIHCMVGVIFFFSLPLFLIYAGTTIIDLTSMTLVTGILFLYLLSVRFEKSAKWFALGIGALLFFSYETKELNLVASFVVIGFGMDEKGEFHWKLLWQRLRWSFGGIAAGVVIFMVLSSIVVHDPFWALRPSEYVRYSHGYASLFLREHVPYDYFRELMSLMSLFLIFLVVGIHDKVGIGGRERIIWFFPFVYVVALTLVWIHSPYGTLPRLLYPSLPVMCMFVPQILHYDFPTERRQRGHLIILIAIGMLLVTGMVLIYPYISKALGWDYTDFTTSFVLDILISLVLIVLTWIRKFTKITFAIALCGVVLLAAQPLQVNYKDVIVNRANQKLYSERISPFSSFQTSIHYTPTMKMLISEDIAKSYGLLAEGVDDIVGLFDLFFDKPAVRSNFTVVDNGRQLLSDIFSGSYDYVFMTSSDWNSITEQPNDKSQILMFYNVKATESGEIYFLQINMH